MSDLDFTKHWTSERTRKKQTALTKLSNGLLKEVVEDPFSRELFELEEIEAMRVAAKALSNAKKKFAHIKEKKARNEKRQEQELAAIKKECKTNATQILDSLNSNPDTFTREQFCLWVTAANFTNSIRTPESWELDINDNMDNHYLENDHALRQRHVWSMRDKAQQVLEECLMKAWNFSFKDESWTVRVPMKQAISDIRNLMKHEEYAKVEKRYAHLLEPLEAYNREVEAIKRRKNIKSI